MTKRIVLVAALVALGSAAVAAEQKKAAEAEKGGAKKGIVQKSVSDLKWQEMAPGAPVQASQVWKGPGGAFCAFNKFPKGTVVPPHTHTYDFNTVVIAGQWGSAAEGAPDSLVGPGSYQFIPAKVRHTTKCGDAEDCVVFTCAPGPFDIKGLPAMPGAAGK